MNYWGIQKHILWLTLLPCLLTALVLGGYFTFDQHQQLKHNAHQQAMLLSQQLAVEGADLFTQPGHQSLDRLQHYLDLPHLRSITLLDSEQVKLMHVGPTMHKPISKRIIENGTHRFTTQHSIRILTPLFDARAMANSRLLGWVGLNLSSIQMNNN